MDPKTPTSQMPRPPDSLHRRHRRRLLHSSHPQDVDPRAASRSSSFSFSINDNEDLLAEILSRLDGHSLGVAACVCRLWSRLCRGDAVWERLCNRDAGVGSRERRVVTALGGYRRLYKLCVAPLVERRKRRGRSRNRSSDHALLSMTLFSVDCYEGWLGGRRSSLMFLCPAS